jgi:ATP-dependent exoDNAse (exonuclease V) beta subunit
MTFTHCHDTRSQFGELQRLMEDGTRYYQVDDQTSYPSVTSVISFISRKKFADWRAKVGEEAANKKTKHATTRGTRLHSVFEHYINNEDYQSLDEYQVPLIQLMFKAAKFYLDTRLDNIYQQETPMMSHRLCLAGTVDLICEVDGELSIVDFKTSEKEKPEEWLEDYFVQLSAYWAMFSEKTGIVPKKLVVFLVAENGDVQIVERRNIMHYLTTLKDYVSQFIQYRDAGIQGN